MIYKFIVIVLLLVILQSSKKMHGTCIKMKNVYSLDNQFHFLNSLNTHKYLPRRLISL